MKKVLPILAAGLLIVSLSACETREGTDALGGAAIGAGVTALVGGPVLAGAAIGAGTGAIVGAHADRTSRFDQGSGRWYHKDETGRVIWEH